MEERYRQRHNLKTSRHKLVEIEKCLTSGYVNEREPEVVRERCEVTGYFHVQPGTSDGVTRKEFVPYLLDPMRILMVRYT